MSDKPEDRGRNRAERSAEKPNSETGRENNPGSSRGGRRRFYRRPKPAAPVEAPEGGAKPAGQGEAQPRNQAGGQSRKPRGARERSLPERDRGPRRSDLESARKTQEARAAAEGKTGAEPSPAEKPTGQRQTGRRRPARGGQQPQARPGQGGQPGKLGQGRKSITQRGAKGGGQRGNRPYGQTRPRGAGVPDALKPPPIKTTAGIKARSQSSGYALSWWAARWISAMENLVDGRRLSRGRSYARDGQVLSIEERSGGMVSHVQGSRLKPYRVSIEITPLSNFEWDKVLDVLASQAIFAAQLLAGEMPHNIEEAFETAGTSLFPARLGDLNTNCTCPDWANPCKHVAATHYILAERFDEDPFLIFRLRGRTNEEILSELRKRRGGAAETETEEINAPLGEERVEVKPLPAEAEVFYRLAAPLDSFSLSFKEPVVEMAVLKRLGDPNFLNNESLLADLEGVYRSVRLSALDAALGDTEGGEEEGKNGG